MTAPVLPTAKEIEIKTVIYMMPYLLLTGFILSRLFMSDLASIPGPWLPKLTSFWTYYHSYIGDEATLIAAMHDQYGPVVRIGPNEVCIQDGSAIGPIYVEKGGFDKAACYTKFHIDGHASIFSELDREKRAPIAKAVLPLFSTTSLREGEPVIGECVAKAVSKLQAAKKASLTAKDDGGPAFNVLGLGRALALDTVTSYLLKKSYGCMDDEEAKQLPAGGFVDRFFYLPGWAVGLVSAFAIRFSRTAETTQRMKRVDDFIGKTVDASSSKDETYQGRLLNAGLSAENVKAQCKDILFAGTDSSGLNIATLCWRLARNPDIYKKLRQEVAAARAQNKTYDPSTLPYLRACVRETLRLSLATPIRLPRVVPASGWTFQCETDGRVYEFQEGTVVSVQLQSLHLNAAVYRDPKTFDPERWIETEDYAPTTEMNRDYIPFSVGARQCIARNLAMVELTAFGDSVAASGVLEGAKAVGDKVEIVEWMNAKVKGERIDLIWT